VDNLNVTPMIAHTDPDDPRVDFAPFDGDGGSMVEPIAPRAGTRPRAVSKGTARSVIKEFLEEGGSVHSKAGAVLWVIEAWCKQQGVSITVVEREAGGYATTIAPI
jgi:hypothetical protein